METTGNVKTRPPAWLRWLANDAARGILSDAFQAPIGCHFFHDADRDEWEVTIFVSSTEVVGGPKDGTVLPSQIQLDIVQVMQIFDDVPQIYWQSDAVGPDDELGQHVSFEGSARGHLVWLRILQRPPQWAGPGRLLHAHTGSLENLW